MSRNVSWKWKTAVSDHVKRLVAMPVAEPLAARKRAEEHQNRELSGGDGLTSQNEPARIRPLAAESSSQAGLGKVNTPSSYTCPQAI